MMKIDAQEIHPCQRELTIEIPPEVMEEEIASAYSRLGRERRIPGFRPGKAPRKVLQKYFSAEAREAAISSRLRAGYLQAIKEQDLRVVGDPVFSEIAWPEGGTLCFKATVEISPPVELKNYQGIRLTRESSEVEDAEIDRTLEDLRERTATFETLEERPLEEGDWALIDYRPSTPPDGQWVEGGLVEITPADKDGISPRIVGMKPGEVRLVKLPAPAGQEPGSIPVEYEVRLQEVKKKVLPEITDEWIRTWGDFQGVDKMRVQIREDLRQSKELRERRLMERQVIDFLLKKYTFPLPPRMLDSLIERYLERASKKVASRPAPEEAKPPDNELKTIARKNAEDELHIYFILAEIARREKIEIDPQALAAEIAQLAREAGVSPGEYRKTLEENGRIGVVKDRILRRLTIDFLIDNAKIKEDK